MKMTFTELERRFLYELGVPPEMILHWSKGQPVGKKYARQLAKVKGLSLEEVLYPHENKEDTSMTG